MILSFYKEVIELIKDSSDTGKGIVVIGFMTLAGGCLIRDILKNSNEQSDETI